jgi:hypothetical protein
MWPLGLFFFEKYFVFATPPKPILQFAVVLIIKGMLIPTV